MSSGSTPSQTVGPYFSIGLTWLNRTDLTAGADGGERVTIHGRVLDGDDQAVPDALLEIWQADANGTYAHSEDPQAKLATKGFLGFGRVPVNDQGEYCFTTIKPGSTPAPDGQLQAPHLEISVFMRGLLERLVTRMYFPAESSNENDPILRLVQVERRATLIARQANADQAVLQWDVRLQGEGETVFFEC
jgi:protocatechuate 3,4-dioxygenase, alpha subunit